MHEDLVSGHGAAIADSAASQIPQVSPSGKHPHLTIV